MDAILNYKPFWKERILSIDHENSIDKLHVALMKMLLPEISSEAPPPPSIEKVISTSTHLAQTLLSDLENENDILQNFRKISSNVGVEPIHALKGAITEWYANSAETLDRINNNPAYIDETRCSVGNIGHLSMLRLKEVWDPPSHPRLRTAAFIANATVSFLYAALLILPHLKRKDWPKTPAHNEKRAMAIFLQTVWQVAREGWNKTEHPPAAEFGAMNTEVKLSKTGNQLLSHVGCDNWEEAAYWYPCRVVPGSAWNKFMRNVRQPVFPMGQDEGLCQQTRFRVPNSGSNLVETYRDYYRCIRDQFDESNESRVELSEREQLRQFSRLGKETGLRYAYGVPLDEETWDVEDFVEAENIHCPPLTKKPTTDLSGNLTLPFLNTTALALRYEQEPDFIDDDFHAMVFGVSD